MKYKVIVCLLFVGLTMNAWAQQQNKKRPTPEQKTERISTKIESELKLDPEKMEMVNKVYADFFETMEEEKNKHQQQMKELRSTMIKDRNAELKKILSEDEYDELIALMETMSHRGHPKRGPHGGRK